LAEERLCGAGDLGGDCSIGDFGHSIQRRAGEFDDLFLVFVVLYGLLYRLLIGLPRVEVGSGN
jgi:hypothetical protein